jgi:SmpA / OmlA family
VKLCWGRERQRVKWFLGVGCVALLLAGCAGGAAEFQWQYERDYTLSEKNRQALMNLQVGMSPEEVRAVMGEPQMVEEYPSQAVWYYRTGTVGLVGGSGGMQGLPQRPGRGADINFTPLVFDEQRRLMAWGKDVVLPE